MPASTTPRRSRSTRSSPSGQVLFEIPTGVVADTRGRRFSFLLGAGHAARRDPALPRHVAGPGRAPRLGDRLDPARARVHVLLGRDRGLARRRAARPPASAAPWNRSSPGPRSSRGVAMLTGSVLGGVIAQVTNIGVPVPDPGRPARRDVGDRVPVHARHRLHPEAWTRAFAPRSRSVLRGSIDGGLRNPPVRWLMLSAPFTVGVGIFAFYALQPYLLQLYGDPTAYGVAGLAAAIVAGCTDRRRADRDPRPPPLPAPDRCPDRRHRRHRRSSWRWSA